MSQSNPSAPGGAIDTPSSFASRLASWIDAFAIRQHRDPVGFFGEVQRARLWDCIWPQRLALLGLCLAAIGVMGGVTGGLAEPTTRAWIILIPLALVLGLTMLIGLMTIPTGSLTSATAWLSFWYIYAFSAPFLGLLFLSSQAALSTAAFIVSILCGLPILLASLLVDAGALLVDLIGQRAAKQRDQFRLGGPQAHRPEISRQRLIFWLRLGLACLVLLGAVVSLLVSGAGGWQSSLFFACAAAAFVRGEAILLAWLGRPFARFDPASRRWHAAYCGRNALLLPAQTILGSLRLACLPGHQASIVMALLLEGGLSHSVASALRRLDPKEVEALLLRLSLCSGAADALRLFAPHLPAAQANQANVLALLAGEAAHPSNLQGWLRLLHSIDSLGGEEEANWTLALLARARAALASYTDGPLVVEAVAGLESLVAGLKAEEAGELTVGWEPHIWPEALLDHLRTHGRALARGVDNLSHEESR